MRFFCFTFLFTAIVSCLSAQSGYEKQPSLLGVHFTLQDFKTENLPGHASTMTPGVALSYLKGVTRRIDIGGWAGAAFPQFSKNGSTDGANDVLPQAGFNTRIRAFSYPKAWQPYASASLDAALYHGDFHSAISPGLGLQFSFKQVSLQVQTGYSIGIGGDLGNRFFYSIGVAGLIRTAKGKTGPRVPDFNPIANRPQTDSDQDGIPDSLDKCPSQAGSKEFNGCPDSDGDGIADQLDQCPQLAGAAGNNGCPAPDGDRDGVPDRLDKCPAETGLASNDGCPLPAAQPAVILQAAAAEIYFETGSHRLLTASYPALDRIDSLLKAMPALRIVIEGHTDNQGRAAANQLLSENRAKAVRDYLVSKGNVSTRFFSAGYGDKQPIATNATAQGRQQNRRVVIKERPQ